MAKAAPLLVVVADAFFTKRSFAMFVMIRVVVASAAARKAPSITSLTREKPLPHLEAPFEARRKVESKHFQRNVGFSLIPTVQAEICCNCIVRRQKMKTSAFFQFSESFSMKAS